MSCCEDWRGTRMLTPSTAGSGLDPVTRPRLRLALNPPRSEGALLRAGAGSMAWGAPRRSPCGAGRARRSAA